MFSAMRELGAIAQVHAENGDIVEEVTIYNVNVFILGPSFFYVSIPSASICLMLYTVSIGTKEGFGPGDHWTRGTRAEPSRGGWS